MRMPKWITGSGFLVLVPLLHGCFPHPKPPVLNPIDLVPPTMRYSNSNPTGYRPLVPARGDFAPAFVFRGSLNDGTVAVAEILCVNLYPDITPQGTVIVLNNDSVTSSQNFGLDLSLLQRLIGANSLSLQAKYGHDASYKVTLGTAYDQYIPTSDIWNGITPVAVDRKCKKVLDDAKSNNQLSSIFVVTRAVALQGLNYTFDTGSNANAGVTVDLKSLLTANPNVSWKITESGGNTTIDPKQMIRIGIIVSQIDQWVPSGAVAAAGAAQVIVKGHTVPGTYSIAVADTVTAPTAQ